MMDDIKEQIAKIRTLISEGKSEAEIATEVGLGVDRLRKILSARAFDLFEPQ